MTTENTTETEARLQNQQTQAAELYQFLIDAISQFCASTVDPKDSLGVVTASLIYTTDHMVNAFSALTGDVNGIAKNYCDTLKETIDLAFAEGVAEFRQKNDLTVN